MTKKYDASQIKSLGPIESIRLRPTMYVHSTGEDGNSHLVREALDNSVDEHLVGYCSEIDIELNVDDSIYSIKDNGRGIPVTKNPEKYKVGSKITKDNVLADIVMKTHSGKLLTA